MFDKTEGLGTLSRRQLLIAGGAVAALTLTAGAARPAKAKDYNFAAALGWTEFESGKHLLQGFQDAVAKLGGNLKTTDASFDPKRQSDQIDAFVSSKPDALFITPADGVAIAPAVQRAVAAGIPVFAADSLVPGVSVTTTVMSNNFGMGSYTADFIARKLGGKGNIAAVSLPSNETWDARTLGMQWALQQYPDIKVVGTWAYNFTGNVTPRQAIENLLTAHADLDAIWCAWDGAAIQGALAIRAAGRENVFVTGIDGGLQPFQIIQAGAPLALTMAQTFYTMTYLDVLYAHELLAGNKVPRIVISPTYAVTQESLKGLNPIPDDYDVPGVAEKLGWTRAL